MCKRGIHSRRKNQTFANVVFFSDFAFFFGGYIASFFSGDCLSCIVLPPIKKKMSWPRGETPTKRKYAVQAGAASLNFFLRKSSVFFFKHSSVF